MRQRIINPKIANIEEPILREIANRIYRFIHPDVMTALAVASASGAFIAYLNAPFNSAFFLVSSLFVITHYICDGIDGKIAKLRGMDTPGTKNYRPYGWHIDKSADFISSLFFISGFFWAITKSVNVTFNLACLFTTGYFSLMWYCSRSQKDFVVGGTESRLLLVVLNSIAFVVFFV